MKSSTAAVKLLFPTLKTLSIIKKENCVTLASFLKMHRHVPNLSSPYLPFAKSRRVILLCDLRCARYLAKPSFTVSPTCSSSQHAGSP